MARHHTTGDARSVADTLAKAHCVVCGFTGSEEEMCTSRAESSDPQVLAETRARCKEARAEKQQMAA